MTVRSRSLTSISKVLNYLDVLHNRKRAERTRFYIFLKEKGYSTVSHNGIDNVPSSKAVEEGYAFFPEEMGISNQWLEWRTCFLLNKLGIKKDCTQDGWHNEELCRDNFLTIKQIDTFKGTNVTDMWYDISKALQNVIRAYSVDKITPSPIALQENYCRVGTAHGVWSVDGIEALVEEFAEIDTDDHVRAYKQKKENEKSQLEVV